MPIKLLAIDLDGTLLRANHTPHPYALEQLARANEAGIRIVIASGRSIQSIRKVLGQFWDVDASVATNGADVWASSTLHIHRDVLNQQVKNAVVEHALKNKIHLSCYGEEGTCALEESKFLDEYRELVKGIPVTVQTPESVMEMPIFKLVFIAEADQVPTMRAELEPTLNQLGADLTESAPRYLEILPRDVNKASGLLHLCEHFGLAMDQVAAIGDYRNDIEMIKIAGLSGAVGNALEEVKELAQFTVSRNEDGGVGEFIARYVLQP